MDNDEIGKKIDMANADLAMRLEMLKESLGRVWTKIIKIENNQECLAKNKQDLVLEGVINKLQRMQRASASYELTIQKEIKPGILGIERETGEKIITIKSRLL